MITDIILLLLSKILGLFTWFLPSWALGSSFLDGFSTIVSSAVSFNLFFPVSTVITIIFTVISFEILILIVKASSGLISLIRGGGSVDI